MGEGRRSHIGLCGPGKVLGFYSECDRNLWESFEQEYDMMKLLKRIALAVVLRMDQRDGR